MPLFQAYNEQVEAADAAEEPTLLRRSAPWLRERPRRSVRADPPAEAAARGRAHEGPARLSPAGLSRIGRRVCANSGHSSTACRRGNFDPLQTLPLVQKSRFLTKRFLMVRRPPANKCILIFEGLGKR